MSEVTTLSIINLYATLKRNLNQTILFTNFDAFEGIKQGAMEASNYSMLKLPKSIKQNFLIFALNSLNSLHKQTSFMRVARC